MRYLLLVCAAWAFSFAGQKKLGNKMKIIIGNKSFDATLADNAAGKELATRLPFTLNMVELNGNEKYADLGKALPTESYSPRTIENGDILLYGKSVLVIFYKTFNTAYSYTRLGKVDDPSGLAAALGSGDITVRFEK
jgi:hypothetical protein